MARNAPGKARREGVSPVEIMRMFPNDATAEAWFVKTRWPEGVAYPHRGGVNVLSGVVHKTVPKAKHKTLEGREPVDKSVVTGVKTAPRTRFAPESSLPPTPKPCKASSSDARIWGQWCIRTSTPPTG